MAQSCLQYGCDVLLSSICEQVSVLSHVVSSMHATSSGQVSHIITAAAATITIINSSVKRCVVVRNM